MEELVVNEADIAAMKAYEAEQSGCKERKVVERKPLDEEATKQDYIAWLNSIQPPQAGQRQSYCFEPLTDRYGDCVRVWATCNKNTMMPLYAISDNAYALNFVQEERVKRGTTGENSAFIFAFSDYGVSLLKTSELVSFAYDEHGFAKAVHNLLCAIAAELALADSYCNKRDKYNPESIKGSVSIEARQLASWCEELTYQR
ncbi:hypothetical protein FACS1894103_4680 [Campylobacterota bacterium]|nr:hypothetical protein FACS1894103_4680 [Campylobacterota bacterium]